MPSTPQDEAIVTIIPKCPTCKGNGRVEMLEHCPSCEGDGKAIVVDERIIRVRHTNEVASKEPQGWYIADSSVIYELRRDGRWHYGFDAKCLPWDTPKEARAFARSRSQAEVQGDGLGFPTTLESVAIEEARQQGESEGWKLFEQFLDRCEGFLDTEGMASSDGEIGGVIERFVKEARDDLDRRRGKHLPTAEQLLAKINPLPAPRAESEG